VFDAWIEAGARRFEGEGLSPGDARRLALTFISLLEGAFVLSQSMKSTEPMRGAGATATASVRIALASTSTPHAPPAPGS